MKELGFDKGYADLAERLLNDRRSPLKNAYLFSQTTANEQSIFEAAKQLHSQRLAEKFYINDGNVADGNPGFEAWRNKLAYVIGYENILPLPIPELVQADNVSKGLHPKNVNTCSEAQALVHLAGTIREPFWHATSSPFHFIRAATTLISRIIQLGSDMKVYFTMGGSLAWEEVVPHSQGVQVKSRSEILVEDMEKIMRPNYQISSLTDLNCYLDHRDRAFPPQPQQPLNSGCLAR